MAEQLTVYEPGDRFATMSADGKANVYEVAKDGRAYVSGRMPKPNGDDDPIGAIDSLICDSCGGPKLTGLHLLYGCPTKAEQETADD